ncbi:MAG: PIN domain nuclease, partial [Clostridiales bacterium]
MKKTVYGVICLLFAVIGLLVVASFLGPLLLNKYPVFYWPSLIVATLLMALFGLFIAPKLVRWLERTTEKLIGVVTAMKTTDIIGCVIGLIAGLIIASLIGSAVARIAVIGTYLAIICVVLLGYMGLLIGYRKRDEIAQTFARSRNGDRDKSESSAEKKKDKTTWKIPPKILDTSVIIDGRIADICQTGFLEGEMIVANFVLEELRHIADSSDSLKRNRGRGGLDILNWMRNEFVNRIIITEKDYPDIAEVDSKLLKLAQDLHGVVVTNDFNLNKVAQLQGMKVLNINELSNAVKPVVLPGEEMT